MAPVSGLLILACGLLPQVEAQSSREIPEAVQAILNKTCLECHSTEVDEGNLNFEAWTEIPNRQRDKRLEQIVRVLRLEEMPPADSMQPTPEERAAVVDWGTKTLDAIAHHDANDPSPILLRRLSNTEYTYTLRDLTGVDSLAPAKEFPSDNAAGEGFTNAGAAMVMSPALFTKYLDAAKSIAEHAVLLPHGVSFSKSQYPSDWGTERLDQIRELYSRYTDNRGAEKMNLQGVIFETNQGGRLPLEVYLQSLLRHAVPLQKHERSFEEIAAQENLSPRYLRRLADVLLVDPEPSGDTSPLIRELRRRWQDAVSSGSTDSLMAWISQWQQSLWKFNSVGHIGKRNGPRSWQEEVTPVTLEAGNRPAANGSDPILPGSGLFAEGSSNREEYEQWFAEFRELFPAALCYSQIVPVDEVVTLTLYHREDGYLQSLMLSDEERKRLDQLWEELHYVTQDALRSVDVYEQLWQYATQDADPSAFEPLRQPILDRAEAFRKTLLHSEKTHVDWLLSFAERAYRRALRTDEQEGLRKLYQTLREQKLSHEASIRSCIARILVAPEFLYRLEEPVETGVRPLHPYELATRWSYFLWASSPDDELRSKANLGALGTSEEARRQIARMLRDPRSNRFATQFFGEWLQVSQVSELDEKSETVFPAFVSLRTSMQRETDAFFTYLVQENRHPLDLLKADYTFVDGPLKAFYGMEREDEGAKTVESAPDVSSLPEPALLERIDGIHRWHRGGVLRQASFLAKQSGASRTSAILRGTWISEVLLGAPLPKPPKNVPALPDFVPDHLSERQLIELHVNSTACAPCHRLVDPFGFSLESFDAIGRHRTLDAIGQPVDTKASLPDGTNLSNPQDLVNYLTEQRKSEFLFQFHRKLLGYALGREVLLSDKPLLESLAKRAEEDSKYGVWDAVEAIVSSRQFREVRAEEAAK